MKISGKLAVITGASRGIGAAAARALAREGAQVVLLARTASDLEQVAEGIRADGGAASCYPVDLADTAATMETCKRILAGQGIPDILVNNAGLGRWLFVQETDPAEAELMLRIPFLAAFNMTRAFLPGMLDRGSGHVVNVNSPVSMVVWGGAAAYASSRWALRGFSESLKVDLRGTGVGVSHCVFGIVQSNYFEANAGTRDRLPRIEKLIPEMTTEQAGRHIVRAVRREKREMTRPFILWLFRRLLWAFPWAVKGLVRRTSYRG